MRELNNPGPIQEPSEDEIREMIPIHAPAGWEERYAQHGSLASLIHEARQFAFVTLAADIRNSTSLQKEAVNVRIHSAILTRFVGAAADTIRVMGGGWFDKFTGDGFLAYWVLGVTLEQSGEAPLPVIGHDDGHPLWEHVQSAVTSAGNLGRFFADRVMADFRANSQNVGAGTGLAMGLDAGPAHFATVAGELTILGPPVVGAVRMVTAAKAGEVLANLQLGQMLEARQQRDPLVGIRSVSKELRATKEFPQGQELYALELEQEPGAGAAIE